MNNTFIEKNMKELDTVIRKVAKKYSWQGLEQEDLVMDLWVKLLELNLENPDGSLNIKLAYTACKNLCLDRIRKQYNKVNKTPNTSDEVMISIPDFTDNSIVYIKDILNQMSKLESEYLRLKAYFLAGIEEFSQNLDLNQVNLKESESNIIAKKLGFANSTSNGYRNLEKRVQVKINAYYCKTL